MKDKHKNIDIDKLIEAAFEIDRKVKLQEDRLRQLQDLARQARTVAQDSPEHRRIKAQASQIQITVVDFGDAINQLRIALKTIK
jgi:hypothetical protein